MIAFNDESAQLARGDHFILDGCLWIVEDIQGDTTICICIDWSDEIVSGPAVEFCTDFITKFTGDLYGDEGAVA